MIKIAFCLRRLPQLTHDEFLRYWYETHASLSAAIKKCCGFCGMCNSIPT
jgi:hypothetical protein